MNAIIPGSPRCCPKCGSTDTRHSATMAFKGYGPGLAACRACNALWEYADPTKMLDDDDPASCFTEPCNNCAFRPGSHEQKDRLGWAELMESLKDGNVFYCHKGVAIEPDAENGFAYPQVEKTIIIAGVDEPVKYMAPDVPRLRICAGYLKMFSSRFNKNPDAKT